MQPEKVVKSRYVVVLMDLKEIGEFGLIDLIQTDAIQEPGTVVVGIGDDAAVLLPTPRQLQLLTADMLVEGVHFDLGRTTAWQLGYKAIAVNLSDIAAMGGVPRHAVISLALPRQIPVEFVVNLYQGMKEICREFRVNIVGGDTVASPHGLIINVAVMGEVEPTQLVRRSGAQVGDMVAVTGVLGSSAAGLDLLSLDNWAEYDFAWPLVTAHLTPRPQVKAGQLLGLYGATSMDDISDGLASEAHEIAKASKVGLRIEAKLVPLAPELKQAAAMLGKEPLDYALYGGEDYQLVFTIGREKLQALSAVDFGVPLTVIGEVTEAADGVKLVMDDGVEQELAPRGYNHFR
ncbi:thiamine-monophosphate kinase [Thermosinus carboxydivorans Nor1]|uniref:Thiamine-monophosphate kinase n=1 Tax=Thermosinus carboxydivorans Nor1 TaxID=401526 RepID=A1HSU1_9FIRM|nr:thiamine-phosphate kinase [Thermosinus carboxydivorans]EAX46885.1 thiamine-monophosphate kinase [Thermosinus carboxydivorans Nor1]